MHIRIPVEAGARVLEIGSGHNPHPRADVLCDRYLEDVERAGRLKRDRPFVLADGVRLAFRDGAFDYVLALHVAEHTTDIVAFFDELARVASAGYIETPSWVGEQLFGWRKHRWSLCLVDDTVYVRPVEHVREKRERPQFGHLFHELVRQDPRMEAVYYRYPNLFRLRLHWKGEIRYRVLGADEPDPVDLDDPETVRELLAQTAPSSAWMRAFVPRFLRDPSWQWVRDLWAWTRRRSVDR